MPTATCTVEPYWRSLKDEDQLPLLAFARQAAVLLAPGFDPPKAIHARKGRSETARDPGDVTTYYGDAEHGFTLRHYCVTHPHWGYLAIDTLTVTAYGLPEGCAFKLDANHAFSEVGQRAQLTLNLEGPADALATIEKAFHHTFKPNPPAR